MGGFEIDLLEASWLGEELTDQCAHGTVRVRVGDANVVVDDLNIAYGARGALATLDADRRPDADWPMFPHACDLLVGCPVVAIDWSVGHDGDLVHLGDLMARPSAGEVAGTGQVSSQGSIEMPWATYREAVVAFARAVRKFYGPPERKIFAEKRERPHFDAFWADFDRLYAKHSPPG